MRYVDETDIVAGGGSVEETQEPDLDEPDDDTWMTDFAHMAASSNEQHPRITGKVQDPVESKVPERTPYRPPPRSIAELLDDKQEPVKPSTSSRDTSAQFTELQEEIRLRTSGSHSPFDGRNLHDPRATWGQRLGGGASPMYSMTPDLPLKNRTEALLFRHYIQKLATCVSPAHISLEGLRRNGIPQLTV